MEKNYNEDYVKGMKFLLNKSKEQGINIRKCTWIPNVSKLLSEHNLCYKFWYNVWEQKNLCNIFLCHSWYDMLHGEYCLFYWGRSDEGLDYWHSSLYNMLGVSVDDVDSDIVLQDMKLK